MLSVQTAEFRLLQNQSELPELIGDIGKAKMVAIDTEADSMYHYETSLCLLQLTLADEESRIISTWIIDSFLPMDLSDMFAAIDKVPCILFHAADYDLRLLQMAYNWRPHAIFDTMLAARVIGESQFGLAALVKKFLGLNLPKEYQRYNWALRPLKKNVLTYAANDTIFVVKLYQFLADRLAELGRTEWHRQFCEREIEEVWTPKPVDEQDAERVWRVKGWSKVRTPRGLAVLRALWYWRDDSAKRQNRPPFKVITNEYLVNIAIWTETPLERRAPKMPLPRNIFGTEYEHMLAAIKAASKIPAAQCPQLKLKSNRSRMTPHECQQMAALRMARAKWAKELEMEEGFVLTNSILEHIVRSTPTTKEELAKCEGIMAWQIDLWGDSILELLRTA